MAIILRVIDENPVIINTVIPTNIPPTDQSIYNDSFHCCLLFLTFVGEFLFQFTVRVS